jgi:hypothetical protein
MLRNFFARSGFAFVGEEFVRGSAARKCFAIKKNGSLAETVCGVVVIKAVVDLRTAASDIR